ncbi:MAG: helix-turn-helix domain-containing protein [Oscillospiraceae bacterium]|nr:helix-turn-helix domain-containing protein [Oscillospiraceae bacterium]
MIVHLNGDYETVDYVKDRSVLLYDNMECEEYPPHWHNAMEIIMPLTNGFEAICGNREYIMSERDLLIIPSGVLHSLRAKEGRRLIMLIDNAAFIDNPALTDLTAVMAETVLINKECSQEFLDLAGSIMRDIYVLYSNFNEVSEVYIYIKVLTLLAKVKEYQLSQVKYNDDGRYAETFSVVLRYIDQNYMNDITLEELSSVAGYSTYHFSRLFKKYSNTTFINFLNRRRVRAAEMMLIEGDMSITDVAMQSGFSSLTTFNRVFKLINGYTPSEYKKLYKMSHTSDDPPRK